MPDVSNLGVFDVYLTVNVVWCIATFFYLQKIDYGGGKISGASCADDEFVLQH